MSPLDICMYEENIRFPEAIALLASRFNVTDELKRSVNKPDIRKRPATADEAEGSKFFELEEKFTDEQLQVLGPRVKQEHVDALHWYVAKSISYVRNREVTTKYTTPTYPILMRECVVTESSDPEKTVRFYKIYEPLNPDKQWRFSYTPDGVKPKQYINGFRELQRLIETIIRKKRRSSRMKQRIRMLNTKKRSSLRRSSVPESVMHFVFVPSATIRYGLIRRLTR